MYMYILDTIKYIQISISKFALEELKFVSIDYILSTIYINLTSFSRKHNVKINKLDY